VRLGLNLGYWGSGKDRDELELAITAEELGYAVCWAAEAYGSDAPTVLSWVAAKTSTIDIGAAVMQIPARSPAMTAMTAATLDALSGGRFRLGLGLSGPQVSEGWHGVRFGAGLARTREYVDVVRMALRRERVQYQGEHFTLPLPDGPGKALQLTVRPVRADIPVYLGAVGPKNLALTGEIADGWLGVLFSPEHGALSLDPLRTARAAAGRGTAEDPLAGFDIAPTVSVSLADDVATAADAVRPYVALYVGGMGSRDKNFYNALIRRMGYEDVAEQVQELYLSGKPREAAAALPVDLLDHLNLLGSRDRLVERLQAYAAAGVTTLNVGPSGASTEEKKHTLRVLAEALEAASLT